MARTMRLLMFAACVLVSSCGNDSSETTRTSRTAPSDGEPDCESGEPWIAEPDIDHDAPGQPTAEAALVPFLEQWQKQFGGEVAMVHGERAALTLDGSEVVVAYVVETTRGGFVVNGSTGCDGYEPEVLPGPP